MTADQIRDRVANRLNLTTDDALARITDSINERYRQVRTAIGMRAVNRDNIVISSVIGSSNIVVSAVNIYSVRNPAYAPPDYLTFVPWETFQQLALGSDPPTRWSIRYTAATTITIVIDVVPASVYNLYADADLALTDISGSDEPAFTEDFHDILELWAMGVELEKKQVFEAAKDKKMESNARLDELKFYQAKMQYKGVKMGSGSPRRGRSNRLPV